MTILALIFNGETVAAWPSIQRPVVFLQAVGWLIGKLEEEGTPLKSRRLTPHRSLGTADSP